MVRFDLSTTSSNTLLPSFFLPSAVPLLSGLPLFFRDLLFLSPDHLMPAESIASSPSSAGTYWCHHCSGNSSHLFPSSMTSSHHLYHQLSPNSPSRVALPRTISYNPTAARTRRLITRLQRFAHTPSKSFTHRRALQTPLYHSVPYRASLFSL
ncbi:hypothetical protein B0H16DRAFT_782240 [Mycena metata]|uniref:Uncharacterized protein n=1 Tax=Mycena metata TaxID=1033252 RepID=A0AAD7NB71_9AGAR|nr:hypothetical protein B0H16DRAFT_782240 [Mycena metata]